MLNKRVEILQDISWALYKTFSRHAFDFLLTGLVLRPASKAIAVRVTPSEFIGSRRLFTARALAKVAVDGSFRDGPVSIGYAKFAIRKGLPLEPNQKRMGVENEAHQVDDYSGTIKEGYGKGVKTLVWAGNGIIKVNGEQPYIGRINIHKHQADKAGLHYDFVATGVASGTRQFEVNIPAGDFKGRYAFLRPDKFDNGQVLITRMKDRGLVIIKPTFNLKDIDFLKDLEKDPVDYIVEWKPDGSLANVLIHEDKAIFRSHRDTGETYYDRLPALESVANHSRLLSSRLLFPGPGLDGTVLRGELFHPEGAARVGGILNSAPDKAQAYQQKHGYIKFYAWDVVKYKGKDVSHLPYTERRKIYEDVIGNIRHFNRNYEVVQTIPKGMFVQGYNDIIRDERGLPYSEGVVVKRGDSPASEPWRKVKYRDSLDVKVVGFTEGTGKYKGSLGSLLVKAGRRGQGEVGTGWTDEQRQWIWDNRDILEGQVAEIYAQELTKGGSVRAGVFYRWHPSKSEAALLMYSLDDRNAMYAMKSAAGWKRR